jgi:hypothetical protein
MIHHDLRQHGCSRFIADPSCRVWLSVLVLITSTGCVGSHYDWRVRTHSTAILQPITTSTLEQHSVAVLPAITLPGVKGNEVAVGHFLFEILQKGSPTWKLVPVEEVTARINRNGLVSKFTQMRTEYEQSAILDRDSLRTIAAAVQARYVFQPQLAAFSQLVQQRWEIPAINIWVVWTRYSIIRMSLSLWDTETGDLVWGSTAEGAMWNEAASQEPVFLEDIASVSLGSMVSDFLNKRTSSNYTPVNAFLTNLMQEVTPKEDTK